MGNTTSVKIEGESNILPYIETYVDEENNTLRVQSKKGVWLSTDRPTKVYVTCAPFR